jgi:hypothetical protein
VLGQSKD